MKNTAEDFKICEVSVSYSTPIKASQRPRLSNSQEVNELLLRVFDQNTVELKEYFKVILLNQANKVLGVHNLSEGGITEVIADIRQIMQIAILTNATGIILSHNHPSGNREPSQEDKKLTNQVNQACNIMNIRLVDHIIVTTENYYSFADEGLI